jgi:hypothetical protein
MNVYLLKTKPPPGDAPPPAPILIEGKSPANALTRYAETHITVTKVTTQEALKLQRDGVEFLEESPETPVSEGSAN